MAKQCHLTVQSQFIWHHGVGMIEHVAQIILLIPRDVTTAQAMDFGIFRQLNMKLKEEMQSMQNPRAESIPCDHILQQSLDGLCQEIDI